jgi:alcohol dehydrogenase class IV
MAALAHGMGHALGAVSGLPHGRAVGLMLPYTIEYTVRGTLPTRYAGMARFLGLTCDGEEKGAESLVVAIVDLARSVGQPTSLQKGGISRQRFEAYLDKLIENALNDSATCIALRFPDEGEMERIFKYAFEGRSIDF